MALRFLPELYSFLFIVTLRHRELACVFNLSLRNFVKASRYDDEITYKTLGNTNK